MKNVTSSGNFQKQFGYYRDLAGKSPVFITIYNRTKLVLMSIEDYEDLASGGADGAARPDRKSDDQAAGPQSDQPTSEGRDPDAAVNELRSMLSD